MSGAAMEGLASVGYVNFLVGIGLAAWARSTGRSGLLWLFFGWILAPIAALVMLFVHWPNARRKPAPEFSVFPKTGRSDLLSVRKDVI